jgi:heme exporter protein D
MSFIPESLLQGFLQRADIGHVALFVWAIGASILVAFAVREAAETARRTETFMQGFLQELSRFNRSLEEEK